jgi:hypothetical protein
MKPTFLMALLLPDLAWNAFAVVVLVGVPLVLILWARRAAKGRLNQ